MRLTVCILLATALPVLASAANDRVDAVLSANQRAMGSMPQSGSAVYHYGYSGDGLTGVESDTVDLGTGAYIDRLDSNSLHTADGFDTRTPWMRDLSGANTPQMGGDRLRVATSAAYRNANLWWHPDRGGAQIEYVGRETLTGASVDHLAVQPRNGVRFDAWFDARTHLLLQIAEPHMFFHGRTVFSDYRREAGAMLAHSILEDPGTGEAGYEHLKLQTVSFGPARSPEIYACPRTPPTGVTLAHGATSISVPFRLLNNHIYVQGRVNGHGPYTFIVDTGGHTLLSSKVIAQAGLTAIGKAPESGAGEKQSSTGFVQVRSIAIGGVEMHDQVGFATEIYSPDIEGIPVDGMVGFELFRRLVVRIDYGAKVLTFTEPGHASFDDAGTALPFVFYDHLPFVHGRIDETPATFDVDTGSRSELDVTSPTVARDQLRKRYPRGVQVVTGWGVGGPAHSYVVRLHSVTLGSVTVSAPVADLSDAQHGSFSDPNFDGNIGSAFLKRFIVTFDYGHQRMYLRPIAPPPPDIGDFDRSGLWINAARTGYVVTSVAAGSPAAAAGLRDGDVILRVGDEPAKTGDLSDARKLLRTEPAGTRVRMLVKGKTGVRRIVVVLRDQV